MTLRRLFTGSVRRQLVWGVATVHAVLMGFFVTDLVHRQQVFMQQQHARAAQTLAHSLALSVTNGLLTRDLAGLQELVQLKTIDSGVAYVMVLDHTGRIQAHTESTRVGQYIGDIATLQALPERSAAVLSQSQELTDAVAPVLAGPRSIGWARVGLRAAPDEATGRSVLLQGLGYTLAAILAGTLMALWMARRLTARLDTIRTTAQQVQQGQTEARVKLQGQDETSDVARSFNRMLDSLAEQQTQLEQLANYDPLTGLPNRRLLTDRLDQAMSHTQRTGSAMATVMLDLDGFKLINDTHGHEAGDRLLRDIAHRIHTQLRGGDTAARLGGDEFVLVLQDLDGNNAVQQCQQALTRMLTSIATPMQLDGSNVTLSASIGATLYPQDPSDADTLLRHADQAMFIAKQSGKNRFHLYDTEHDRQLGVRRVALERLAQALQDDELLLYYQPKVHMRTGELQGVEALIRWQHPDQGLLAPALFLHTLDGNPLELAVGDWVIRTALAQAAAWRAQGLPMSMSINVSPRQVAQAGFVARLAQLLAEQPTLPPQAVELELLESAAVDDRDATSSVLQACRRLGVRFALDDFGTGYSSLVHLRRMPVDTLKIDQSFVRDMLDDPDDLAIVESVVRLCASFRRHVVAEGVETELHASALLAMGCNTGQGYGIARPMPAEALPAWLKKWRVQGFWQNMRLPQRNPES